MADATAAAATVIALAVIIGVAALVLGGPGGAASGTSCDGLPGQLPAGVRNITQAYTVTTPGGTCYRNVTSTTTVQVPNVTQVWALNRTECVSNGTNTSACDAARIALHARLDAAGYVNFKPAGRCTDGTVAGGINVRRSVPETGALDELGYCYGRMWVSGTAHYLDTYTYRDTVTVLVDQNRTTTTRTPYACPDKTTLAYRNVTVAVGTTAAPGSWAAACEQARDDAAAAYALLAIVVLIAAAAAVLGVVRWLGGAAR